MNAEQAKKLTKDNLTGPVIEPLLEAIYKQIEAAAKAGRYSIVKPWSGIRMVYPTTDQQNAVWAHLRREGYTVTRHPDPDPGHPASSTYDEISWG